jgi:hypothetical protein
MKVSTMMIIALLSLNFMLVFLNFTTVSYTIFVDNVEEAETVEPNIAQSSCLTYFKECRCLGVLWTSFGSDSKYTCFGFNFCRNIDVGQCN